MLVSKTLDTCVYDDGSILKSLSCPIRLRVVEQKRETRPLFNSNSPGIQMLIESARAGNERMRNSFRDLENDLENDLDEDYNY